VTAPGSGRSAVRRAVALVTLVVLIGSTANPAAASTGRTTKTVYSYGSDALQTVTVYRPTAVNGDSVVLVHGGGFRSSAGDASKLATEADSLAAFGDTVFVVNYRDDTGGVGIADQVADVVAGTEWSVAHAAGFGADPATLSVVGGSSGGLLAADAAEQLDASSPGAVRSVVTLSGTMDFATAFSYWQSLTGPLAQLHLTNLSTVLGCTVVSHKHVKTYTCPSATEVRYSPDQQVTGTDCPTHWLILNGLTEEQPTSQAVGMDDALAGAGCAHTLDLFADSAHAFDYWSVVLSQVQGTIAAA
jgi:acetyl esterase/lipase